MTDIDTTISNKPKPTVDTDWLTDERQTIIALTGLFAYARQTLADTPTELPSDPPTEQPAGRVYTDYDTNHSVHYRPRLSN